MPAARHPLSSLEMLWLFLPVILLVVSNPLAWGVGEVFCRTHLNPPRYGTPPRWCSVLCVSRPHVERPGCLISPSSAFLHCVCGPHLRYRRFPAVITLLLQGLTVGVLRACLQPDHQFLPSPGVWDHAPHLLGVP